MRWRGWLLVGAAAISGCASLNRNTLPNTHAVKAGMTTAEVTTLLGKPPWSSDPATVQEWRYCSTDRPSDLVVAIFFRNDVVVEKTSYRVDLTDNHFGETTGGRIGSCRDTISDEGPDVGSQDSRPGLRSLTRRRIRRSTHGRPHRY